MSDGLSAMTKKPKPVEIAVPVPAEDARCLSLSEAIATFHAHAVNARRTYNGRERTLF
jgi:hypothetical protein